MKMIVPESIHLLPLGTCSANRTKYQKYCSFLLEIKAKESESPFEFLLDCGSIKCLTEIDPYRLKAIFITHIHLDHTKFLPKLIRTLEHNGRKEPLQVFVHKNAIKMISLMIKFPFFKIPSFLSIQPIEPNTTFTAYGISISSVEANHPGHALALKFSFSKENNNQSKDSIEICFCPDTSAFSTHLIPFFKDADYVLMDTTFNDKGLEKYIKIGASITHCSPKFSGPILKAANVKTYIAIHYYWKRFGKTYAEAVEHLRTAIYEFFRNNIIISEDLKPIQLL